MTFDYIDMAFAVVVALYLGWVLRDILAMINR